MSSAKHAASLALHRTAVLLPWLSIQLQGMRCSPSQVRTVDQSLIVDRRTWKTEQGWKGRRLLSTA